ncbi:MAG TPA: PqqD family protein [Microbacterium sp.]|nr:PqqD family protein [Microbacterium sp.]
MNGYRPGDDVGIVDHEEKLYVAALPDGPIVVLDGISALIWDEACAGPRETLVDRVAALTTAAPEAIRAHVDGFVADLVARRLLQ